MLFTPEDKAFLLSYLRDNIGFIKRLFDEKSVFGSSSRHVLELISDGEMNIDHRLLDIKNSMNLISLQKRPLTTNDIRAIAIVDGAFDAVRQGTIELYQSLDFLSEKDDDRIAKHTAQIKELLGPHKTSSSHSSGFRGRSPEASASTSSSSMSSFSSSSSRSFARLESRMDDSHQEEPYPDVSIEVDPATPLLDEEPKPTIRDLLHNEWEYYTNEIEKPGGRNDENMEALVFFEKMKDKTSYSKQDLEGIRFEIAKNTRNASVGSGVKAYTKNQTSILTEITSVLTKPKKSMATKTMTNIPFFTSFDDDSKPPSDAPLPTSKKPG